MSFSSLTDALLLLGGGLSNETSSPPPSPPADNDDLANGICTNDNLYFILKVVGCALLFLASGFMSHMVSYRPSTAISAGGGGSTTLWKPYYGRPYALGLLGMGLSVWSLLPSLVMFVVFHMVLPDIFPMVTQMACTQMTTFPFLPVVVVAQMGILFLVSDASAMGDALNPLINNNSHMAPSSSPASDAEPSHNKVLMLGAPSCGLMFARAMKDECDGVVGVETSIFDFSRDREFLIHNAVAMSEGLCSVEKVSSRITSSKGVTAEERLTMPFPDSSFDKIVVCPSLRITDPIGTRLSSEQTKSKRMSILLGEAVRVLRPGGAVVCVDSMEGTLLASADMRDLTGDGGIVTDPCVRVGSLPDIFKTRYMHLLWTKPSPTRTSASNVAVSGTCTVSIIDDMKKSTKRKKKTLLDYLVKEETPAASSSPINDISMSDRNDYGLLSTETSSTPKPLSSSARTCIVAPYQLVVYTAILFSVAALFSPLNVPADVVLSLRVNSFVASMSMTYPIVTFFIRYAIDDMEHITTKGMLLKMVILTDCVAILMTIGISTFLWLPQFLVQVSLSPTGLSANAKTYIGIAVSIVFGVFVFKVSHWRRGRALVMSRQFNDEQIKMFNS